MAPEFGVRHGRGTFLYPRIPASSSGAYYQCQWKYFRNIFNRYSYTWDDESRLTWIKLIGHVVGYSPRQCLPMVSSAVYPRPMKRVNMAHAVFLRVLYPDEFPRATRLIHALESKYPEFCLGMLDQILGGTLGNTVGGTVRAGQTTTVEDVTTSQLNPLAKEFSPKTSIDFQNNPASSRSSPIPDQMATVHCYRGHGPERSPSFCDSMSQELLHFPAHATFGAMCANPPRFETQQPQRHCSSPLPQCAQMEKDSGYAGESPPQYLCIQRPSGTARNFMLPACRYTQDSGYCGQEKQGWSAHKEYLAHGYQEAPEEASPSDEYCIGWVGQMFGAGANSHQIPCYSGPVLHGPLPLKKPATMAYIFEKQREEMQGILQFRDHQIAGG